MDATPEFMAALDRHHAMSKTLGVDHELTQRALALVMALAPPELTAMLTGKAREMGLIPDQADGYLEDGTPVYQLESIARTLGMTEDEAQESVQAFMADRAALGLDVTPIDPALIHHTH